MTDVELRPSASSDPSSDVSASNLFWYSGERVIRILGRAARPAVELSAAAGQGSAAGRGGAGTPVGAAEGAVGLLLFFADMVFSRGLHVAFILLSRHVGTLTYMTCA